MGIHSPFKNPLPLHLLQGIKPLPRQGLHSRGLPNCFLPLCASISRVTSDLFPEPSQTKHLDPPAAHRLCC